MSRNSDIERHVLSKSEAWVFDDDVSSIFDMHVRRSVPCYEDIQELISSISADYLHPGSVVYDLGTATGEVIYNIDLKSPWKDISYVGIDNSPSMIRVATHKCSHIRNAEFICDRVEDVVFPNPSDLIISAFTLQFLDPADRLKVLCQIKKTLTPRGIFILCEKVVPGDKTVKNQYISLHEKWKSKFFSEDEIRNKKERLVNVMRPLSAADNMKQLREAGFRKIIPFFQWCNFICWTAR
jgi:tRNA (cmo5U34)-methyltransferase